MLHAIAHNWHIPYPAKWPSMILVVHKTQTSTASNNSITSASRQQQHTTRLQAVCYHDWYQASSVKQDFCMAKCEVFQFWSGVYSMQSSRLRAYAVERKNTDCIPGGGPHAPSPGWHVFQSLLLSLLLLLLLSILLLLLLLLASLLILVLFIFT